jgi:hypothetical protein
MTDTQRRQAITGLIESYTKLHSANRASARAALINEGIYTRKGKLRAEFGGSDTKPKGTV